MYVITVASSAEIHNIRKKTIIKQQKVFSGRLFIEGVLSGKEVLIVKTGVGIKKAEAAAREIIQNYTPYWVLLVGAAGATDPALHLKDILVVKKIIKNSKQNYLCDDNLSQQAFKIIRESGFSVTWGDCLTVDRFVHLKEEKREFFKSANVHIIDMESAAIAKVLYSAKIPFLNVRFVTDTAREDTVDLYNILLRKKTSGIIGVFEFFLKNPSQILKALRFKKNVDKICALIPAVAEVLVKGIPYSSDKKSYSN